MRTTLIINDELFAAAKRVAADRRCSLSSIVNDALRSALKKSPKKSGIQPFEMPTYGGRAKGKAKAKAVLPDEMARIVAEDDLESYRP